MSDEPKTLDELCDYIVRYADSIFVREKVNGKRDAYSLAQLPAPKAIAAALGFIKRGAIPVRFLSEAEVRAQQAGQG